MTIMKKSTTILLLVAALSFGYLPTCTMNVEASNPTAVTDKDPKDHKTKKPHHKKPEPPHKVHHRKPEPPHKVHGHRPPRRPMPPVGTHYRERPQHCISISFNHAPYFFAEGIFYRYANANYVVVRPEIGMIVPLLPETGVYRIKKKGETLYVCHDVLYRPFKSGGNLHFKIVGFL